MAIIAAAAGLAVGSAAAGAVAVGVGLAGASAVTGAIGGAIQSGQEHKAMVNARNAKEIAAAKV